MCARLGPRVFRAAASVHPWLPLLLPECRTIQHARQELRWLVQEFGSRSLALHKACIQRSQHIPLQYILGSQPFGDLDIKCKKNVLIPRWETEEWSMRLTRAINETLGETRPSDKWRITDLCTGTGCIPLTIFNETRHLFKGPGLDIAAADCSPAAIRLVNENYTHNFPRETTHDLENICFEVEKMDILDERQVQEYIEKHPGIINILTCNPPYIRKEDFIKDVRSSVRSYEPKLALVADLEFYENLVDVWIKHNLIESFVYELGDAEQAKYVKENVPAGWEVGARYDSDKRIRCVYGYNTASSHNYKKLFERFAS